MESMRGRGRGKRARGRGRGAAKRKKSVDRKDDSLPTEEEDDEDPPPPPSSPPPASVVESNLPVPHVAPSLDMEADISQLEAPTFTTISRGPPEPMLRLKWGHPVNLLGEKVLNPMIHCCDTCLKPVLIYGRMIPCKHVFCLACAQRDSKQCPRCSDKVVRVEQTGLGTVFMCTHGGTRYGNTGCRRTYLSQRDLQAHINHRHVPGAAVVAPITVQVNKVAEKPVPANVTNPPFYDAPKVTKMFDEPDMTYPTPRPPPEVLQPGPPPMVRMPVPRPGNLITVPIQEPPPEPYYNQFNPPPGVPHPHPHGPHPPPINHPPPPSHPHPPHPQHPQFFPSFDYPPPDTSIPPPIQWPGNPPFYG